MNDTNNYKNVQGLPQFGLTFKILELREYTRKHPEENLKVVLTKSGIPILTKKGKVDLMLDKIFGRTE